MSGQGKHTTKDTSIVSIRDYDTSLDGFMTDMCLYRTMGDVVRGRESAANAKTYTVSQMIFNAVFEMDVDLIRTIALRIDGTVPEEDKRDGFANLIGDAVEDVLSYTRADQMQVVPDDKPIIAMAKALVFIATQPCGSNYAKRKERNLAAQMILERCGGRKVQPTKLDHQIEYVEPEWMKLPGNEEVDDDRGDCNAPDHDGDS